ncbi:hypothetical protein CYG48_17695 (plasmid) [Neorhizobium sp. SOG26]|nr:hypothetical protein CYG48_17695 [Neorhizobium sp. SOG26]
MVDEKTVDHRVIGEGMTIPGQTKTCASIPLTIYFRCAWARTPASAPSPETLMMKQGLCLNPELRAGRDAQSIGFFSGFRLTKVPVRG